MLGLGVWREMQCGKIVMSGTQGIVRSLVREVLALWFLSLLALQSSAWAQRQGHAGHRPGHFGARHPGFHGRVPSFYGSHPRRPPWTCLPISIVPSASIFPELQSISTLQPLSAATRVTFLSSHLLSRSPFWFPRHAVLRLSLHRSLGDHASDITLVIFLKSGHG